MILLMICYTSCRESSWEPCCVGLLAPVTSTTVSEDLKQPLAALNVLLASWTAARRKPAGIPKALKNILFFSCIPPVSLMTLCNQCQAITAFLESLCCSLLYWKWDVFEPPFGDWEEDLGYSSSSCLQPSSPCLKAIKQTLLSLKYNTS